MTDEISGGAADDEMQAGPVREAWSKPEILSYRPAVSAEGISYNPADGIANLTP